MRRIELYDCSIDPPDARWQLPPGLESRFCFQAIIDRTLPE